MDQDYNPGIQNFTNEIDDEQTIEEEENLSEDSDNSKEIETLKQESEMPLEKLLMMYNFEKRDSNNKYIYTGNNKNDSSTNTYSKENDEKKNINNLQQISDYVEDDDTEDEDYNCDDNDECDHEDEDEDEDLNKYNITDGREYKYKHNKDLFNLINSNNNNNNNSFSEDDDYDFDPSGFLNSAKIRIGLEFQIELESTCKIYNSKTDQISDYCDLVWDPLKLEEKDVINYLKILQMDEMFSKIKEDEKALSILNECNYVINDAVYKYNELKNLGTKQWTKEECEAFEEGYKEFGKDFKKIHENKCNNYTMGEIVHYYYLWKKTERYDAFVNKFNIKKKHHIIHPTATDYMEKFLIEKEESFHQMSMNSKSTITTTQLQESPNAKNKNHNDKKVYYEEHDQSSLQDFGKESKNV